MKKPIDIIYILSSGHSGSTLLDLLLGSHSCIESVGEVKKFSKYMSPSSQLPEERKFCTCGVHVSECDYWQSVREKLDPSVIDNINLESEFAERHYHLMSAILEVSDKKIICDSSKDLKRLSKFLASDLFTVNIIHLVRDGRAFAYSMKSKQDKLLQEEYKNNISEYNQQLKELEKRVNLYQYPRVISTWSKSNVFWYNHLQKTDNYYLLKYEDLVVNPSKYLTEIVNRLGLEFEDSQLEFYKFTHHNLSGNRMRKKPRQTIEKDIRYLEGLSTQEWWLGTLLAFPGLQKFEYPLRIRRS